MQDMQKKTVRILSMVASAFLFTAGVSLSVISCSKAIVREEEPGHENAITFSGVDTRAAVEDASGINEFSVWGYYTPEDAFSTVFDKVTVTRENSQWTYDGLQYWKSDKQYDFYALYPTVEILTTGEQQAADNITCNASGVLSIIGFNSTKGHDLMTASRTGMSGGNPQMVDLKFSHELVRLSFKVHAENAIVVSACLYGVNYGGTLKKEKTSEWTELEKAGNAGTTPFRGNDIEFVDGTADLFGEILILPHTDLSEARLDLTFKTSDTGPEKTLTYNLSNTDVSEWTAGKSYGYNVILSGNMDLTVTVSNWVIQDTVVEW